MGNRQAYIDRRKLNKELGKTAIFLFVILAFLLFSIRFYKFGNIFFVAIPFILLVVFLHKIIKKEHNSAVFVFLILALWISNFENLYPPIFYNKCRVNHSYGDSMLPAIPSFSYNLVCPKDEVEIGDIVLFRKSIRNVRGFMLDGKAERFNWFERFKGWMTVQHRVIGQIDKDVFLVKGDNTNKIDFVKKGEIFGVVVGIVGSVKRAVEI